MTTTISPETARARVARIVDAYAAAERALVELSDAIHDAVRVRDYDDAIAAGYALAYSGSVDAEGVPTGLLVHEHGDRLLVRAADIRHQLDELIEASYEVPSDFTPDPNAVYRLEALRRDPAPEPGQPCPDCGSASLKSLHFIHGRGWLCGDCASPLDGPPAA